MDFSSDDRHILVITGEQESSLQLAKQISRELESVEIINQTKALGFLGQELDAVIFDMHSSFDPNAFGAISGTIRGGGYLILLRPSEFTESSLFLHRFNQILENTPEVHFLKSESPQDLLLKTPSKKTNLDTFATRDQESAVKAILKVVTGHRRRPLIITSDRGRGKSAALGIAAAELAEQGIENIIICAPSKKTAEIVYKHAQKEHIESNLTFYSPDDLQQQKPKADLVLIDEAAAIPLPLLTQFLKTYSRIVFASTQHGYEGSGRGFAINFHKVLDSETPQWNSFELTTPIRWQENDSLEKFTFDALLLITETNDDVSLGKISLENCQFNKIAKQSLIKNTQRLKQLFGLLVSAHYQTKPSDLKQLLDDENMSIFCLESNNTIIAVALLIAEGNIDPALTEDIFAGKRRLQGHLVAQALSSNIGIESAPTLSGERISRIAVHPQLQGKGFGSLLLKHLIQRSIADYLSTCFGATESLINFWKKSGFSAVHLGIKRDASSGAHSVTMLLPKTESGTELLTQAQTTFARSFPELLSDSLNHLEPEIVRALLPEQSFQGISHTELQILESFANDSRGFENSLYLIHLLALEKLPKDNLLDGQEKHILIIKVLQKIPWKDLITKLDNQLSGKKEALAIMRNAVKKLIR